jgi:enoyl-CoA hydratase/carnithine racemase
MTLDGHIATIMLDRPPVNALSGELIEELAALVARLGDDDGARVGIITGDDRKFSAGVDIRELRAESVDRVVSRNRRYQAVFASVAEHRLPFIAAINGYALGGGLELALACDIIVASEDASLGLPEITLGGVPGIGGMQRLSRVVGAATAKRMVLTGDHVSGVDGYAVGLVTELAPPRQALVVATKLAETIAARPPVSVQAARQAIDDGAEAPLRLAIEADLVTSHQIALTQDRKECVAAFLEKRPPRIVGR